MDKKSIKGSLEKERDTLVEQLREIAKLNTDTNTWEAMPEAQDRPETDQNDMADRAGDFEDRSARVPILEERLAAINSSLSHIDRKDFAKCVVCGKSIEAARMNANPAAKTCIEHVNEKVE